MGNGLNTPSEYSTIEQSHHSTARFFNYGHVDYAVLENLLRNTRSDQVRSEFFMTPESSYTEKHEIRIWACTFNLNGRKPPEDLDFDDLVRKWESSWPQREDIGTGSHQRPDLYILGFQEAVPLTAQNVIAGWTTIPIGWDRSIDRALNQWKTEEELVRSPMSHRKTGDDILDTYLSQWTGTPSANLQMKVDDSFTRPTGSTTEASAKQDATETTQQKHSTPPVKPISSGGKSIHPKTSIFQSSPPPGVKPEAAKITTKTQGSEDSSEEYVQIIRHQLVGLYITCWARKSLLKRITGIQVTTVATGALGYLANKGAIAARMRIDDSAFVFITSHLASGSHEGDEIKRNLDYKEIIRRTQFPREITLVNITREDGTIIEDFSSRPDGLPENPSLEVKRAFVGGCWTGFRALRDLDNIIWVGDLNYRINGACQDVIKLIRENKLDLLLKADQLTIEKAAGNVFQNFKESSIDFNPTYKFIRGTDYYTGEIDESSSESSEDPSVKEAVAEELTSLLESQPTQDASSEDPVLKDNFSFDSSKHPELLRTIDRLGISTRTLSISESQKTPALDSYPTRRGSEGDLNRENHELESKKEEKMPKVKKIRTPAWTDRILYYSSNRALHQLLYGCFSTLSVSDHRPVIGAFIFDAKKFNEEAVESALHEARRVIDRQEIAAIPRCSVTPTFFEVGNIVFGKPLALAVTVSNTGEVPAAYSFLPGVAGQQGVRNPLPKWLTVKPTSGMIKAGTTEDLEIVISIEGGRRGSAEELFGKITDTLDHILILHIEGGSDFFISIVGSFTLSCFGLSLNNLARHLPNNRVQVQQMKSMKQLVLPSLAQRSQRAITGQLEMSMASSENSFRSSSARKLPQQKLNVSTSISRTGPQPNLVEGPTGLMIPSQVMRMVRFLGTEDRLKTPQLFIESWDRVKNTFEDKTELDSIVIIREALDKGEEFPLDLTPHDMAAALLSFFYDLPSPMIPESIAQTCEKSDVSCMLATSLVEAAMSAVEWSVFDTILELMRSALLEENTISNQLTIKELTKTLSEVFFQCLNTNTNKSPLDKDEGPELTPRTRALIKRRCVFVEHSLGLDSPLMNFLYSKDHSEKVTKSS